MTEHNCRVCGVPLVVGENITQPGIDNSMYICRDCNRGRRRGCRRDYYRDYYRKNHEHCINRNRDWRHSTGRQKSMSENKTCASFLGVYVTEEVLSHVFKDVQRMPYGNIGFDFICCHDKKIDVKSSCRHRSKNRADHWLFAIRHNHIADDFLCLAFNNRDDLEPEHIWLIPGSKVNDCTGIGISVTTLDKWSQYEQPLDNVLVGCNALKDRKLNE